MDICKSMYIYIYYNSHLHIIALVNNHTFPWGDFLLEIFSELSSVSFRIAWKHLKQEVISENDVLKYQMSINKSKFYLVLKDS